MIHQELYAIISIGHLKLMKINVKHGLIIIRMSFKTVSNRETLFLFMRNVM